jgi:hypothetical protein
MVSKRFLHITGWLAAGLVCATFVEVGNQIDYLAQELNHWSGGVECSSEPCILEPPSVYIVYFQLAALLVGLGVVALCVIIARSRGASRFARRQVELPVSESRADGAPGARWVAVLGIAIALMLAVQALTVVEAWTREGEKFQTPTCPPNEVCM